MPVANKNLSAVKAAAPFAFAALIAGNAALSAGPLFVRLADVGPVAAGFWRLALALPVIALFAWRQQRAQPLAPDAKGDGGVALRSANVRPAIVLAAMGRSAMVRSASVRSAMVLAAWGGLFFAADLASWHVGILQTKLANATLFGNCASLILVVVTLVAARRLPSGSEGGALLLALAGGVILMRESADAGRASLVGDLLCLLAGILYAGYMLTLQRARGALASWPTLAVSSATGVLPLLALAWLLGEAIMPGDWRPVVALAFTSQLVGQGLLIYALPHFSPLIIGLTLLTQPALTALIGWWFYNEQLTTGDWIGALLLAAALVLVRLPVRAGKVAQVAV